MRLFLEGNIGAGKSSLLRVIQERAPEIQVALEPCDTWLSQENGKVLLAEYYKNPSRWAYLMELAAMTTRVQAHLEDQKRWWRGRCRVVERSIYSGHYCFALDGMDRGVFTKVEWEAYTTWFKLLVEGLCRPPSGFIYLEVSPEICYRRVRKRGRSCEASLDVSHLGRIRARHDKFLLEKCGVSSQVETIPVLRINGDEDFVGVEEREKYVVDSVVEFVSSIGDSSNSSYSRYCKKSL